MNGLHARYGGSAKWCNFSFSTEKAPAKLLKLSEAAGLPKELAVISFVCAKKLSASDKNEKSSDSKVTIVSDPIYLPGNRQGFYSCSENGMVLVLNPYGKNLKSGDTLSLSLFTEFSKLEKDHKSGAPELKI